MKNFTFSAFLLLFISVNLGISQNKTTPNKLFGKELTEANKQSLQETGYIKCGSYEYEQHLKELYPNRANVEEFENWLAPKIEVIKAQRANSPSVIITIPVIFHVFTDGVGPENLSQAAVQAQIDQLNIDFSDQAGSPFSSSADTEIRFCLAKQNESGAPLTEDGINRITFYGEGPFSQTDFENSMKAATQWDPTKYFNVWSANLSGGLLGYAQFPDSSGLQGLNTSGGASNTDGVVVLYSTVGSIANPNPNGFTYNAGRTLTHEAGHWLGLRHIWGDTSTCTNDDYCADTPDSDASNFGCPTTDSCFADGLGNDMVENYMDYTDDSCMHTFTADQKTRILAVMSNSPRRVELANSTVCNAATTPLINFDSGTPSPGQIAEGSDCNFTDIDIDLNITIAPNSNAVVSLVNSGTATENEDFELINNAVTFSSGSTTPSNTITLRVYNDNFVESDETIILSLNLTTPADAITVNSTYDLTVENDDNALTSAGVSTIFYDGFENYPDFTITPVGGWTLIDNDGDSTYSADNFDFTNEGYTGSFIVFNPSSTTPAAGSGWDAHTGSKGYYCFNSTGSVSGSPLNDDYAITPQINLNGTGSELKFWAQSLTDNYAGGERFQVAISTTDTNPSSFTTISAPPYVIPPLAWTEYTYDLSAYDGMNIYIAIHVVSADEFVFMLDDISVTANVTTSIQTTQNTSTPDQFNLSSSGLVYSTDVNSGNVMVDIDNTSGFDYGCTTVAVSRDASTAGADAVAFNGGTNPAGFVTAKTFDITTANSNTSETSTINFYFTQAEIAAWETATGNSINNLFVLNETTGEYVAVTNSTFGSDYKLTANLSTGIAGTYYFGTQTSLGINDYELENSISIYPNPTVSILNIKVDNLEDMPESYKVYNMLGQILIDNKINNTGDLTIDTSSFSNGMYFIKISKSNRNLTLPFIKK